MSNALRGLSEYTDRTRAAGDVLLLNAAVTSPVAVAFLFARGDAR
jgi:hypothetical protein